MEEDMSTALADSTQVVVFTAEPTEAAAAFTAAADGADLRQRTGSRIWVGLGRRTGFGCQRWPTRGYGRVAKNYKRRWTVT